MMTGIAALSAFESGKGQGHNQQTQGKLRRRRAVKQAKPTDIDARGKGLNTEIGGGSVISQGFHQSKQHTPCNRRASNGQTDAPECAPWPLPQRARRDIGGSALAQKRCARQKINIRVKHQDQHCRRTTK